MISQEKWMILTPLQKLHKNVGDLGKIIVAKGLKKLSKVKKSPNLVTLHPSYFTVRWSANIHEMIKLVRKVDRLWNGLIQFLLSVTLWQKLCIKAHSGQRSSCVGRSIKTVFDFLQRYPTPRNPVESASYCISSEGLTPTFKNGFQS